MTPSSRDHLRLWLKLLETTRQSETLLRENLRRHFGTTLPRFDVMAALDRFPKGLRMSDLSRELRVSNGNVTGIVDRLVDEGLVAREGVPGDRRAFRVLLTPQGRAQFAAQARAHARWVSGMMAHLGEDKTAALTALLDELAETPSVGRGKRNTA
ncbi:MAG: MarR family winged helix-turn-helix transcriptional regulator [Marinibacterium sp.]|nr:MarR family winged helix-turn-helix transcriptional regulator [Marinibacterium sp.]